MSPWFSGAVFVNWGASVRRLATDGLDQRHVQSLQTDARVCGAFETHCGAWEPSCMQMGFHNSPQTRVWIGLGCAFSALHNVDPLHQFVDLKGAHNCPRRRFRQPPLQLMAKAGLGWWDHIPALKCHFLGTWEDHSATASDFVQMSPETRRLLSMGKFRISTRSLKEKPADHSQWPLLP